MVVQPRTDWLEQASRLHTCPLCVAGDLYESDYLGALCVQLAEHGGEEEGTAVARELCAEHTTAFGEASRTAGVNASTVLAVHLARLGRLAEQLAGLDVDSWPIAAECGLCFARNEVVLLCAHRILAGLEESSGDTAHRFAQAGGLCAAHFATCWEAGSDAEDRDALRRMQLDAVQRLARAADAGLAGDEFDDCRAQALAARATLITSI